MKDALGHGSNGLTEALRARLNSPILKQPNSASAKSAPAPVHSGLGLFAGIARGHEMRTAGDGGHVPNFRGGQSAVRAARGVGSDWSADPIQNLKGTHR